MQGKFEAPKTGRRRRRGFSGKTMALLMALVLVAGCVIGGTLAWLFDESKEVRNTFSPSDISIVLEETEGGDAKEFPMIPGYTIGKNPVVTVDAGSEKCFLFVKVTESDNLTKFISYVVDDGIAMDNVEWTELDNPVGVGNFEKVYYRVVDKSTEAQEFHIIGYTDSDDQFIQDKVLVNHTVTKTDMNALTDDTQPTLTFMAYASQYYKNNAGTATDPVGTAFEVAEAWKIASSYQEPNEP